MNGIQISIGCDGDWVCNGKWNGATLAADVAEPVRAALQAALIAANIDTETAGAADATVDGELWTAHVNMG
jgi:propanediol dehydratase large subunit